MERLTVLERERRKREAELALLGELRDDNRELRALLAASRRIVPSFQAAELMNIDLNPWSHRVLINRGRRDGLLPGQPVMDMHGVMGQIGEAGLRTAEVVLISDPDHALPVRVERTGLRTVAYGSGRINQLRLTDLPMNVDLRAGDRLLTSGLGGAFPAGLPVAEIDSVSRPVGEAFARAIAQPLARLDRARHVLVVYAGEPDEPAEAGASNGPSEAAGQAPAPADRGAEAEAQPGAEAESEDAPESEAGDSAPTEPVR